MSLMSLSAKSLTVIIASPITGVMTDSMRAYVTLHSVSVPWHRLYARQSQNVMQNEQSKGFSLKRLPVILRSASLSSGMNPDKSATMTVAVAIISSFIVQVQYLFLESSQFGVELAGGRVEYRRHPQCVAVVCV